MQSHAKARDTSPRLRQIFFDPRTVPARLAALFVSPVLQFLDIEDNAQELQGPSDAEDVNYFLQKLLFSPTPRLSEVEIMLPGLDPLLLEKICALEALRVLYITISRDSFGDGARTSSLIRRAFAHPIVQWFGISVDPLIDGFPDLVTAQDDEEDDDEEEIWVQKVLLGGRVTAISDLVPLLPADSLDLSFVKADSQAAWNRLLSQIFQHPTYLNSLEIKYRSHEWQMPIAADHLLHMPAYPHLSLLQISAPFMWTDQIIDQFTRSCPSLMWVSLFRTLGYGTDDLQLTCASLKSFAMHCSRLHTLCIMINPSITSPDHTTLPAGRQGNVSVRKLKLEDFMLDDDWELNSDGSACWSDSFVEVLDCLFPNLKAFTFRDFVEALDDDDMRRDTRRCVLCRMRRLQLARGLQPEDVIGTVYKPDLIFS